MWASPLRTCRGLGHNGADFDAEIKMLRAATKDDGPGSEPQHGIGRAPGRAPASYALLCLAMPCYALLCRAMPCYALLCLAMPCYALATPCYALGISPSDNAEFFQQQFVCIPRPGHYPACFVCAPSGLRRAAYRHIASSSPNLSVKSCSCAEFTNGQNLWSASNVRIRASSIWSVSISFFTK